MNFIPEGLKFIPLNLIIVIFLINIFGILTLYSAAGGGVHPWALKQIVRFILLFILMIIVSCIDSEKWFKIAYPLYAVSLSLLLVVEISGKIGMGAQRWIDLGVIRLQPSEIMKIAVVLALARFYNKVPPMYLSMPSVIIFPLALVLIPVGLVMLQPDLGTAMMISFTGIAIIFLAGTYMRWFVGAGLGVLAMLPVAWNMLHEYQRNRVLVFINPDSDPLGTGYHIGQSKIAIGSGGIFGKGYLNGTQSHLEYLPETHTDFVFATMTEEWGLVGGIFLLCAYGYLIYWGNNVGFNARTVFNRLLALGLSFSLFLYVAINIGMVMGVLPVVGIPLPLMSYGGSAMMTVFIILGILISLYRHQYTVVSDSRF